MRLKARDICNIITNETQTPENFNKSLSIQNIFSSDMNESSRLGYQL